MKILVLTKYFWPHIGGVEKHVEEVSKRLALKGNKVILITEKYDSKLKSQEVKDGVKIVRFKYPNLRCLGLFFVWLWLWQNRGLIKQSDIVQIHDVFVWYLPFRFLFPAKPVFTAFHGWEGVWPLRWQDIFAKRWAVRLSSGTLAIGAYVEKYYGLKVNKILYGAV